MRYAKAFVIMLGILFGGILLAQAEIQDSAVEPATAAESAAEVTAEVTAETTTEATAEVTAETEVTAEVTAETETAGKTVPEVATEPKAAEEKAAADAKTAEKADSQAATNEEENKQNDDAGLHFSTVHAILILAILVYIGLRLIPGKGWKIAPAYLRIVLLCIAAFLTLIPFVWLICSAFKDKDSMMKWMFLPLDKPWFGKNGILTLENFKTLLFKEYNSAEGPVYFHEYIVNSLFLSCAITSINIFLSSMAGYALAKYRFKGRSIIVFIMLGSMMFPAMLFLAPLFKMVYVFGWMDSYLALIVPGAITVFGIFLFRQAMVGVPTSLLESARVDGASEFRIYWEITLPLVRPITAAYCLISFLGTWNAFLQPQLFIQMQSKLPLPVVLNQFIGMYVQEYGVFLAGTLLAIIPPAILFFVLQKEFVAGLTSGATKG